MRKNPPFRGMTMILVEDDALLRESFAMFFRIKGFIVRAFAAAEEALAAGETALFDVDVAISDYRLPGADGLTLLKGIGESHPGALRILITAHADAGTFHEASKAGIDDVLLKPFTTTAMEDTLHRLLEGRPGRKARTL